MHISTQFPLLNPPIQPIEEKRFNNRCQSGRLSKDSPQGIGTVAYCRCRPHIGRMAWDLAKAMAKKGEFESARLADFEFRQRARTFRLMAEARGEDPSALVSMIAQKSDDAIL